MSTLQVLIFLQQHRNEVKNIVVAAEGAALRIKAEVSGGSASQSLGT